MNVLGLDIGGANIKSAHSDGPAGCVPFALWREPQKLTQVLAEMLAAQPAFDRLAVTMTGELCDCFATKRQGVVHILDAIEAVAPPAVIGVWETSGQFVSIEEARADPIQCAAANWHALATYVAALYPKGASLLIDTGSTTTDIIILRHGRPAASCLTDTARLMTGELVYLGVDRTPLMALGPTVSWLGGEHGVMAELFATTADVNLLLGRLPEQPDCTDTADGRPMTRPCAAARIVRIIGADLEMLSTNDAQSLAEGFAVIADLRLAEVVARVIGRKRFERVVVSGSGAFLAERAAQFALPQVPIEHLADHIGTDQSVAACAFALVQLSLTEVLRDSPTAGG